MNNIWNNQSLSEALEVKVGSGFTSGGILQFNSKDVRSGDIFIALQGANGNGHDYALNAFERGASCIILEREIDGIPKDKIAKVQNTQEALRKMAKYKRSNSKAVFIAVTGSVGKTSTKEALLHTVSIFGKSFASRGSFNNLLGITLDLASMADDIKYAIFEVGMNHLGEIRELIPYIAPDIALINNIMPVHIGNFASLDGVADAKLEILEGLNPKDGIAIFNKDNVYYDYCCDKAKTLGINKILSFGDAQFNTNPDSSLVEYEYLDNIGSHIIKIGSNDIVFKTKIGGRHRVLNLAPVLLICQILGLDLNLAAENFIGLEEPKGRGRITEIKHNRQSCIIIDDSYNASPVAIQESLKHLKEVKHHYKVAILGDMRELGDKEIEYHVNLKPQIIESGIKKLHTVGKLMYELHSVLPVDIRGNHFADYEEVINHLDDIIDRDMMILLKASKGIKLWQVVDTLLAESIEKKA